MAYGDKRDYPKIEIYVNGVYKCTTTWSRTLTEAKEHYLLTNIEVDLDKDIVSTHFSDK